jgi:hypothetical protein
VQIVIAPADSPHMVTSAGSPPNFEIWKITSESLDYLRLANATHMFTDPTQREILVAWRSSQSQHMVNINGQTSPTQANIEGSIFLHRRSRKEA